MTLVKWLPWGGRALSDKKLRIQFDKKANNFLDEMAEELLKDKRIKLSVVHAIEEGLNAYARSVEMIIKNA